MSQPTQLDRIEALLLEVRDLLKTKQPAEGQNQPLEWTDTSNPNVKRLAGNKVPQWLLEKAKTAKYGSGLWYAKPTEEHPNDAVFKNVTKWNEA